MLRQNDDHFKRGIFHRDRCLLRLKGTSMVCLFSLEMQKLLTKMNRKIFGQNKNKKMWNGVELFASQRSFILLFKCCFNESSYCLLSAMGHQYDNWWDHSANCSIVKIYVVWWRILPSSKKNPMGRLSKLHKQIIKIKLF